MTKTTTTTSLRVSRVIRAPREKVFAAFIDPDSAQSRRFAPNQAPGRPMRTETHVLEPRVGGRIRASMSADEGEAKGTYTSHGVFLEIVPHERIVRTFAWEDVGDEEAAGETRVTFTFRDVPGGTEVTILHDGLPGPESVESHAEGWSEALENFAAAF